jgi:hypothetical protein
MSFLTVLNPKTGERIIQNIFEDDNGGSQPGQLLCKNFIVSERDTTGEWSETLLDVVDGVIVLDVVPRLLVPWEDTNTNVAVEDGSGDLGSYL